MSSANYEIFADAFGSGGDSNLSSLNYFMVGSTGEVAMGFAESSSFRLNSGVPSIKRQPSIGITVSPDQISLGMLSSTSVASNSHGISSYSNSKTGYVLKVYGETLTTAATDDIDAIGASSAASNPGTEQFGINLVANTVPAVGAAPVLRKAIIDADYGTVNQFAFLDGDTMATATKPSNDTFTASYIANISAGTAAGQYETLITFSVTSNF
ncbi:MAG: hypothetical protein GQ527_02330 [Bacteroidales bacterium]|nr:hypothetical protein [Bacteroidales bacterium]